MNLETIKRNSFGIVMIILFVAISSVVFFDNLAEARTTRGDMVVSQVESIDNYAINMELPAIASATSTVLTDLSDVTNFPHYMNSGAVELSRLSFGINNSTGAYAKQVIKVGVISSTTPSGNLSDIYWFDQVTLETGTTTTSSAKEVIDYSPSVMNTRISSASPVNFLSNDSSLSSSYYSTTTAYTSPAGSYATNPGVGDVVVRIYSVVGTATTTIQSNYKVIQ